MWDEIPYPSTNFNGCTVEVWEWINNFMPCTLYNGCNFKGQVVWTKFPVLHYWSFVRGILQIGGSPHKGPVTQSICPCHEIIMSEAALFLSSLTPSSCSLAEWVVAPGDLGDYGLVLSWPGQNWLSAKWTAQLLHYQAMRCLGSEFLNRRYDYTLGHEVRSGGVYWIHLVRPSVRLFIL